MTKVEANTKCVGDCRNPATSLSPFLLPFPYPLISYLYSGHSSGAEQRVCWGVAITSMEVGLGVGGGGEVVKD